MDYGWCDNRRDELSKRIAALASRLNALERRVEDHELQLTHNVVDLSDALGRLSALEAAATQLRAPELVCELGAKVYPIQMDVTEEGG